MLLLCKTRVREKLRFYKILTKERVQSKNERIIIVKLEKIRVYTKDKIKLLHFIY